MPERTYAKLFRRADRGRLAVTLLDRRDGKRTPLVVTVDLKTVGVGAARKATLVTLEGRQPLPTPTRQGSHIIVTVPPYKDRPAAILIETETDK